MGQDTGPWELDGEFAPWHCWPQVCDSLPTQLSALDREIRLQEPAPPRSTPASQPGSQGMLQQGAGPPQALPDLTEQWMCALDS